MATIVINIPDAIENRVLSAFSRQHGYKATVENPANGALIPNPESKRQFTKRITAEWFRAQAIAGEQVAAVEAARQDAAIVVADIN